MGPAVSVHVCSWAWKQKVAAGEKLVLLKLADSANDDGLSWPAAKTVARDCGMGESTVRKHVNALAAKGLLSVEERRRADGSRSSNLYRLATAQIERGGPLKSRGAYLNRHEGPSPSSSEASPPTKTAALESSSPAQLLVGAFVDEARERGSNPPKRVIGQVASAVKKLLEEGVDPRRVALGLLRLLDRNVIQPTLLPNFVMEAELPTRTGAAGDLHSMMRLAEQLEREGR